MSTSLFFNLSFDLGGISLILFVVWFFVNFNNAEAAFKWFSLSILALLASVIILSYGATKLAQTRSSLPRQNETEIIRLKQEVTSLKERTKGESHSATTDKEKTHPTHHEKKHKDNADKSHSLSSLIKLPRRIINPHDNELVKKAVTKHPRHVYLIGKVTNPHDPVLIRGVHSNQYYKIKGLHKTFKPNEFVIIKGTATSVYDGTINVTAHVGKHQPGSPIPK